MPRKSAESLAIAPPTIAIPRLAPPAHLSAHERGVWLQVTGALPAGWFTRDQTALLERYVVHVVRARNLEALIGATDPVGGGKQWDRLTRLAAAESRVVIALARSMRLTPRSRQHRETAARRALHGVAAGLGVAEEWDADR